MGYLLGRERAQPQWPDERPWGLVSNSHPTTDSICVALYPSPAVSVIELCKSGRQVANFAGCANNCDLCPIKLGTLGDRFGFHEYCFKIPISLTDPNFGEQTAQACAIA